MVNQGYKQTEIGVIPEDWECTVWENAGAGFSSGATPYRATEKYYSGSIKWVSSGELNYNVIFDTLEHISDEAKVKTNLKLHPANTFLMAITGLEAAGTRGSCAILGVPATTNQSCMAIYGTSKLDIKYLFYFYTKNGDDLAFKFCQGTKQQSFTAAIVKNLPIVLPPIEEQKRIAEALSDVDGMISSLEKLIAKKKAIKQGAMQELLTGEKRLAGFAGKWRTIHLGEISKIKTGYKNNEQKTDGGKYPFFVRSQQVERINTYSYDGEAILVPGEGNIGQIFHYINGKFDWHQRVYKISDFPEFICGKYIYYQMKFSFGEHALKNTVKATVDSLRLPTFENFEILVPPTVEEQNNIASVLTDMDSEIEVLEQKLAKMRRIKQGMMQQLLTGKIRVV